MPLTWLGWLALSDGLGANPIEFINRFLGEWAIRILIVAISITPFRKLFGWKDLARYRRLIGLFAFFYVCLHLSSYVILDQFFDWQAIWKDILKRTYITVGMIGVTALIPLAITSTKGMIRRMGGRNWNRLHKLVYVAAIAAGFHFIMMRKGIQTEPLIHAGIIAFLLIYRVYATFKKSFSKQISS